MTTSNNDVIFLKNLFKDINLGEEYSEFAMTKLYKYADNPIIAELCAVVQANKDAYIKILNIIQEASAHEFKHIRDIVNKGKTIPFMIITPDNLDMLRIFPSIVLNEFDTEVADLSPLFCNKILSSFIKELEDDLSDDKKKLKWEGKERISSRLNQYVDVKTASALTRYIFDGIEIQEAKIRDLATAIEVARKPFELIYAETPKDFVKMYATGPQSCMSSGGTGSNDRWAFFKKELTPPSFFAYCPLTKGVYAEKNGAVVARTILYNVSKKKDVEKWEHGRIYYSNSEYKRKFENSLNEADIKALSTTFRCPNELSWKVPGFKMDGSNVYAMPWPYFDNMNSSYFRVTYDKATNEFTVYNDGATGMTIHPRSGHLRSSDYFIINCSHCKKVMKPGNVLEVDDPEINICSDKCALELDFVRVIDGANRNVYIRHSEDMIDIYENGFIKVSTLKAGLDLGFTIEMPEAGILPEEGEYRFVTNGSMLPFNAADGIRYGYKPDHYDNNPGSLQMNKIPIGKRIEQKTVTWMDDQEFFTFVEDKQSVKKDVDIPF